MSFKQKKSNRCCPLVIQGWYISRVRRVFQLRVGLGYWKNILGWVGLGTGYLYQIPIQLGIIGYCNLDREFAEYLPYFLYFLIFDILYTAPLLWRENVMVASTKSKIKVNFSREETDCFQIEFYFQRQLCRAQSALEKQQMLGALGMRLTPPTGCISLKHTQSYFLHICSMCISVLPNVLEPICQQRSIWT